MSPHLIAGGVVLIVAFIGFMIISSAGLWKLVTAIILWTPLQIIPEITLMVSTVGFLSRVLATLKIPLGELILKHYAAIASIVTSILRYYGGVLSFI